MRDERGRFLPLVGDERDDDGRHALSMNERMKGYESYLRAAMPSRVRSSVWAKIRRWYQTRRR